MGLSGAVAWGLLLTQNFYLLMINSKDWLSESIMQFIVLIGAVAVAVAIALSMNTPEFNKGQIVLGGILGGLIAGGFLLIVYSYKIHNK